MAKSEILSRLAALREEMRREGLSAFIFPSSDPHASEYTPERWKGREWISGFDGSAGTAVVTMESAALWTDSRYFLAAAEQLEGTGYKLMKERIAGTPSIAQWLGDTLRREGSGTEVGIDGLCVSTASAEELIAQLRSNGGLTLRTNLDILQRIWTGRPKVPADPIEVHPQVYAGESAESKLARIREALLRQKAVGMLMSALDDIAWTLNLRGTDVHCNPVFVAYLLIGSKGATLFTAPEKITLGVKEHLAKCGVKTAPYDDIGKGLDDYFEYSILLDPAETSYTLWQRAKAHKRNTLHLIEGASPVPAMKAIKNETEAAGFRDAMKRDGVAMVKFLRWLLPAVQEGGQTELSISRRLMECRQEQDYFRGLSFDTICAWQQHGAIVHYEPTEATDIPVKAEGLLLIDSGGQYADGTTDITRTIALGPLTEEQRKVYTLVLKGHIALAQAIFPSGASGTQLDILARKDMWAAGYNYLHGTGHGVGSYLNVHEGPHQIRMEWKPAPIVAGMTVTDEPGIYLDGRFGVRTENTMIAVPYQKTEFGDFLAFEPLTLCPIDKTPIIASMLTDSERQWLDSYHQRVFDTLSPLLCDADRQWLQEACKPLK